LNTIKIEEDKQFLLKQRQKGRPGCMLGIDMKLTGVENRKICRQEEEEKRKNIQQNETENFTGNF
jgi:adenylate/nucleoside-diphosphate kinase